MPEQPTPALLAVLAEETGLKSGQVARTVALLDEGATVPFIARYRKEVTGELDEVQIRLIQERLAYQRELNERRAAILASIEEQGKLSDELRGKIDACRQKTELEDLYLPYKPKRRTKASIARERGLEPLAELLLGAGDSPALELAAGYVNPDLEVPDAAAALEGAGHILAERLAEDAAARASVRELVWNAGRFCSQPARGKEGTVSKYEMYYDFAEPVRQIPSHRMLAMRRGEAEEILAIRVEAPQEEILVRLKAQFIPAGSAYAAELGAVVEDAFSRLLSSSIVGEVRLEAKLRAEAEAIRVFADNLRHLLLAAPAGSRRVLGVDPGLRTGSKLAVVDATGAFREHVTIYPHAGGAAREEEGRRELLRLLETHAVEMVAIGNGTAGREMEQFVRQTLKGAGLKLQVVMVSEAGASVYSASEIAREEFPDLDLTVRGAISIARRLQDPLAELVKVDPKSIGVGQYQHDVDQRALKKALDEVVESCVNFVGVDLNTASWALLSFVSGISETLAKGIVAHRDRHGAFTMRAQLLEVARFGPKAYEQAAGFLRIRNGAQPLDNTAVHPERYPLVERMAGDAGVTIPELIAAPARLEALRLERYVGDDIGLPTLRDILAELKKPGRDPRATFVSAGFREDVTEITDLKEGMTLNGVVTNVAAFGAFVDIGVHQDGLVHISQLADRYVRDPAEVVKVGQPVQVKVVSVDLERRRIGLSMRTGAEVEKREAPRPAKQERNPPGKKPRQPEAKTESGALGSLADAFAKSGFRVKPGK